MALRDFDRVRERTVIHVEPAQIARWVGAGFALVGVAFGVGYWFGGRHPGPEPEDTSIAPKVETPAVAIVEAPAAMAETPLPEPIVPRPVDAVVLHPPVLPPEQPAPPEIPPPPAIRREPEGTTPRARQPAETALAVADPVDIAAPLRKFVPWLEFETWLGAVRKAHERAPNKASWRVVLGTWHSSREAGLALLPWRARFVAPGHESAVAYADWLAVVRQRKRPWVHIGQCRVSQASALGVAVWSAPWKPEPELPPPEPAVVQQSVAVATVAAPPTPPAPTAIAPAAPAQPDPPRGDVRKYYVQVKALSSLEEADAFVLDLVSRGHRAGLSTTVLPDKRLFYRVRVGPFATLDQAKSVQKRIDEVEGPGSLVVGQP
jgi:cell division septation protein DedD